MELLTFTVIPPQNHTRNKNKLIAMKKHYEKGGCSYGPLSSKATYILFEEKKYGILGSACLLPPSLLQASRKAFKEAELDAPRYWECSHIFFNPSANFYKGELPRTISLIREHFYEALYCCLEEMSMQQGIPQIVTFNPFTIHEDTKSLGKWSFEVELELPSPFHQESDYILGILPLASRPSFQEHLTSPH